ncbi:transketolase [Patescibacteria group bacterium]|nr:transketolase [Patescibacteria group bacterium]
MDLKFLKEKAAAIRKDALFAINKAGRGFSGSAMSYVEILVALYYGGVMNVDPKMPGSDELDYFVLGKGHAAISWYAALADIGYFEKSELDHYQKENSFLSLWPNLKIPGVKAPVQNYGQGLSFACGLAMSLKMDRKPNRVFAVLGDGELACGQTWEAAMSASHYNLDNLIVFVDNDGLQLDGPNKAVMDVQPIQDKFEAFGWKVIQVRDGHDFDQILDALAKAFTTNRMPTLIWCHTVKGKGVPFAEGKESYHDAVLSDAELKSLYNA